jgi:hypothetical protein
MYIITKGQELGVTSKYAYWEDVHTIYKYKYTRVCMYVTITFCLLIFCLFIDNYPDNFEFSKMVVKTVFENSIYTLDRRMQFH